MYDENKAAFDFSRTNATFTGRYYFNKGRLIDFVATGYNRCEGAANDPRKVLAAEALEYQKLLGQEMTQ